MEMYALLNGIKCLYITDRTLRARLESVPRQNSF